ncbi:MAG TPA: hypothetical protein PLS23_04465, partial [Phycisphaerae bacterium]|nr:hypothetical protein [Phycisphaerae bacterium]
PDPTPELPPAKSAGETEPTAGPLPRPPPPKTLRRHGVPAITVAVSNKFPASTIPATGAGVS